MSPSLVLLLTHYRHELAVAVERLTVAAGVRCPQGEELLWAEAGEADGWLQQEEAMEVRRLATRVQFYEGRVRADLSA